MPCGFSLLFLSVSFSTLSVAAKLLLVHFPQMCATSLQRELSGLTRSLLQGQLHFKQEKIATCTFSVNLFGNKICLKPALGNINNMNTCFPKEAWAQDRLSLNGSGVDILAEAREPKLNPGLPQ